MNYSQKTRSIKDNNNILSEHETTVSKPETKKTSKSKQTPIVHTMACTPEQLNSFWTYDRKSLSFLDEPINLPIYSGVQTFIRGPFPTQKNHLLFHDLFKKLYHTISKAAHKRLHEWN